MKKKLFFVAGLAAAAFTLGACGGNTPASSVAPSSTGSTTPSSSASSTRAQRYTVAFEVDGERYKTLSVKEGETITEAVPNPEKEGWKFDCWMNGTERVEDLTQFVVTGNVTLTARFVEAGDVLNVDDVKDASKTYHMVLGWWESTNTESTSFPYSGLTKESVRLFYGNLIKYLKKTGASDADIAAISFRNYSSADVASMGGLVNADNDVDLLIGVGANVFTTAGCLPYHESADSKFDTVMGTAGKTRYVAMLQNAREVAQATYEWLQTDAGKKSFLAELTDEEIEQSLQPVVINLTVTVHGDTDVTTTLTDKEAAVEMPTITDPEGKEFKGFATSAEGEIVLTKAKDAVLKYDDLKGLVAEGATTLDLYPVFEDLPQHVADLTVYIQTHASRLPEYEAHLIEARFESVTNYDIDVVLDNGDASGFKAVVEADLSADVAVGGNNPLSGMQLEGTEVGAVDATHCANGSRKVIKLPTLSSEQAECADAFYNFMTAVAAEFEVHTTFWGKNHTWVTEEEEAAIKETIDNAVKAGLNIGEGEDLSKYNVVVSYADTVNTGVADLGNETRALRDGKGTDIIVGCGANVTTTGGFADAEVRDIPAATVAAGRKIALINDNVLTRLVVDTIAPAANE